MARPTAQCRASEGRGNGSPLPLSGFNTSVDFSARSVTTNQYQKTLSVVSKHCMDKRVEGCEDLHESGPSAAGAAERSPMWLLVMVLLNIVPGLNKVTVLNTFATAEECQVERNRIGFEMAAAYPNERDFVIACQLNPKHSS